ncbi:MAG TPA: hypothetical protein VJ792_04090 [Candidatus Nitrosotalea sp.]|nr:hypothetical protein [Candidatus Nitrosotalea sp.]
MDDKDGYSRTDLLSTLDSFIARIFEIRRILLSISVSALILAPLATGLSVFLLTHPRFYAVLQTEHEFGTILGVLLGIIISISVVWIATGIKQYVTLKSWDQKYKEYVKQKDEIDRKIASDYGLEED